MPRYINPENIKLNSLSWVDGGEDILVPLIDVRKAIAQTPSEDVVAVVRCKDCKYWQDNNGGYPHEECRWGKDETPDADDFCSYGERYDKS